MAQNTESYHCPGCGVLMQSELPGEVGYIPDISKISKETVCQRCYRIHHYNDVSQVKVQHEGYFKIIHDTARSKSLVVHIVDIFDFEGTLLTGLSRMVGKNPILLVVNKVDLLPNDMNPNKILNWLRKQISEAGVHAIDIILCSAKSGRGISQVASSMDRYRDEGDVFVVGATNVGKSTFINRLIRDYSDMTRELTTSRYPGTTLDMIRIPLDGNQNMIDTPGVVLRHRIIECIKPYDLNVLVPKSQLKPRIFQLDEQQTLFFGAMVRLDYLKGEKHSFTCFTCNSLHIHRTKLTQADALYERHKGVMLSPPKKDDLDDLPKWRKHSLHIAESSRKDICISGLGWIKVSGTSKAEILVHAPAGVQVIIRDSMI